MPLRANRIPKYVAPLLLAASFAGAGAADMTDMPGMSAADHAAMQHDPETAKAIALQGPSLYQVQAPLTDQTGQPLALSQLHSVALLTMFYGDCQYACPIIIESLKRTAAALPEPQRSKLRIVMISLNPGIDTSEKLSRLMQSQQLDPKQFTLAVSDNDADTRQWAAVLGIKYRRAANGEINHSSRQILLDATGVPIAQNDKLNAVPDPEFVQQIRAALQ